MQAKLNRLQGYLAFWKHPTVQHCWGRVCRWTARALEKLADGG
ncbi:MAG: hypothetical protein O7G88_00640 [bacterium]|nr:hypothetical protein [bacterium]